MNEKEIPLVAKVDGVHKSRWGYHAVGYEDFLLLKKLAMYERKAYARMRAWIRWGRKDAKNRVMKRKIRNEKGQKIGEEVVGIWLAPMTTPLFTSWRNAYWCETGSDKRPTFIDMKVALAYHMARHPVASPEDVKPLPITMDKVRQMLKELEPKS